MTMCFSNFLNVLVNKLFVNLIKKYHQFEKVILIWLKNPYINKHASQNFININTNYYEDKVNLLSEISL